MSYNQPRGGGRGRGSDRGRGGGRGQGGGYGPGGGYGRGQQEAKVFSPIGPAAPPPSMAVAKAEDAILSSSTQLQLSKLGLKDSLPLRAGYGTMGKVITLWANYVEMVAPKDLTLYRYDISVSPTVVGRKLTQIIQQLLRAQELAKYQQGLVSDFKSTLISRKKLGEDETAIQLVYHDERHDEPRADAPTYTVNLEFTNTLSIGDLVDHLRSPDLSVPYAEKLPTIQALNIFLNHYCKVTNSIVSIGTKKAFSLDTAATYNLGAGLTAMRGFFASVRSATARILVNVNVSHGVFYNTGPLNQLMAEFQSQNHGIHKLNSFVKKIRVTMQHLPNRTNKKGEVIVRVKTILGLATLNDGHNLPHPPRVARFGAGPTEVQFWMEGGQASGQAGGGKKKGGKASQPAASSAAGGKYVSVYDYFKQAYRPIAHPNFPVVNVGTRENPCYLPPEVCRVVPGQNAMTKLSPGQTQNMIKFAVRKPWMNAESILGEGLDTSGLTASTNPLLRQFGISVPRNLLKVTGRVLTEPSVLYHGSRVPVRGGGWNMTEVKFNVAGALKKWSYLIVSHPSSPHVYDSAEPMGMLKKLADVLERRGITVSPPLGRKRIVTDDPDDPKLKEILQGAAGPLDLLIIILPNSNSPLYHSIKTNGDTKFGIHTICVVADKLAKERGQDQYFNNVALKFNLKLGGRNQLVDSTRLGIINEDKTMVVGVDVTHPSPGSIRTAPSIAGMVASIDKYVSQWPGVLRLQSEARQEMVSDMKNMLKSRLRLWKELGGHKVLPENILVYRDGVSEGQYQKVLDEELPLFREACKEMYPPVDQKAGLPRITIIVVGKRHHTRFYPTTTADADRGSNVPAGTVVDRGITEAPTWDFFLQSHTAIQGTARPAHYIVILDEVFRHRYKKGAPLPPGHRNVSDVVENLCQALCYTYGRATKAVSICAPVYYADILCERGRLYLKKVFDATSDDSTAGQEPAIGSVEAHPKLRNSMFYI